MCIHTCGLFVRIAKMFARLFKTSTKTRLGRWSLVSSQKVMNRKVELANHDHCGPCPPLKKYDEDAFDNSMDIAVCALQSLHVAPMKEKKK